MEDRDPQLVAPGTERSDQPIDLGSPLHTLEGPPRKQLPSKRTLRKKIKAAKVHLSLLRHFITLSFIFAKLTT